MFKRKSLRILFLWVIVIPLAIFLFVKITGKLSDAREERRREGHRHGEDGRNPKDRSGNVEYGSEDFHEGEKEFSREEKREEMSFKEKEVESTLQAEELEDSEKMDRVGR